MGPNAGVDYNLALCPLQSRLKHIYHGQPFARAYLNPMQRRLYSPVRDFGVSLWGHNEGTEMGKISKTVDRADKTSIL